MSTLQTLESAQLYSFAGRDRNDALTQRKEPSLGSLGQRVEPSGAAEQRTDGTGDGNKARVDALLLQFEARRMGVRLPVKEHRDESLHHEIEEIRARLKSPVQTL